MKVRSKSRTLLIVLAIVFVSYGILSLRRPPLSWTHYEHEKALAGVTMATHTAQGIPGDPINVGLVGTKQDILCAMHAADWYPADPVTFRSSVEIIGSVILHRPYRDAHVQTLSDDALLGAEPLAGRRKLNDPHTIAGLNIRGIH